MTVTGLIIWPRIDDQRQRSLLTGGQEMLSPPDSLSRRVIGLAGLAVGIRRRADSVRGRSAFSSLLLAH
jgi:hypothetical protein